MKYSYLIMTYSTMLINIRIAFKSSRKCIHRNYSKAYIKMMPEGPEVRSLVDYVDTTFFDQTKSESWHLVENTIVSGRYKLNAPEQHDIIQKVLPSEFLEINSKGKFIYFEFKGFTIWSTLGLSGYWKIENPDHSIVNTKYQTKYDDTSYLRLQWIFESYQNKRKLILKYYDTIGYGTIKYSMNRQELEEKLSSLGPCWLTSPPTYDTFITLIKKAKKRYLAIFLMDQSKTAGIGNYILSEILYMSNIYPWITCDELITYMSTQQNTDNSNSHNDNSTKNISSNISSSGEKDIILELYNNILYVINTSYNSQSIKKKNQLNANTSKKKSTPTVLSSQSQSADSLVHLSEDRYMEPFIWKVYSQSKCPQRFQVIKEKGPHKRSVHWVPQIQVIGKVDKHIGTP